MLEQLGQYKILDRIGAGGMGEVYRARDTRLGRTVAIKVLPDAIASDVLRRDRFMADARAAAQLSHPNIATAYEAAEDQNHLFLALEFVPGEPLGAAIGGRPMNPRLALHLAGQIGDALADAHALGIIHRDLRPDNIVVTPKGNAKILDFGFANWTRGGTECASAYVSPEQAIGEQVDQRTDIFSLGILLYEMLTGVHPFPAANAADAALRIAQARASAPSVVNASLPRELDPIVARALSKEIDGRYESAAALAAELRAVDAILDVRAAEAEKSAPPILVSGAPRRRSMAAPIAIALVAAALLAAWWFATG